MIGACSRRRPAGPPSSTTKSASLPGSRLPRSRCAADGRRRAERGGAQRFVRASCRPPTWACDFPVRADPGIIAVGADADDAAGSLDRRRARRHRGRRRNRAARPTARARTGRSRAFGRKPLREARIVERTGARDEIRAPRAGRRAKSSASARCSCRERAISSTTSRYSGNTPKACSLPAKPSSTCVRPSFMSTRAFAWSASAVAPARPSRSTGARDASRCGTASGCACGSARA